jgi:prepilin-type processing-associated H-X9-DG protein
MGKQVKITAITDGTSNTMMASEIIQGRNSDLRGFTWWGGSSGFTTQIPPNNKTIPDVITGGICDQTANPWMPCTYTSTNTAARMIGARSWHTNGLNASMCDGSVRFVTNTINQANWMAASTAQGGETIGLDN